MKTVAFWSPYHGQAGTTSNLICIGCFISVYYNLRTLLLDSEYKHSSLEEAFIENDEQYKKRQFYDIGMDSLERLARSNQLKGEKFTDYTKILINKKLDLLMGTTKTDKKFYEQIANTIPVILEHAKTIYDLNLCDVGSGNNDLVTNKILKVADLIVVCLNQNIKVMKHFFEQMEEIEQLKNKKLLIILGNYEENSKYTTGYIKRLFKYKDQIYCINRNTAFMDAHNDNRVIQFFFANNKLHKSNDNIVFLKNIDKISQKIIDLIGINSEFIKQPSL